jgi:methylglyoxal synthase
VDVKALLRITVLYNVPTACNRSTADFIISSALFSEPYSPKIKDYEEYIGRDLEE